MDLFNGVLKRCIEITNRTGKLELGRNVCVDPPATTGGMGTVSSR